MKTIKVLGTGCAKCKSTVQLIEQTARAQGVAVSIEKVEDPSQIMAYGVMSTPAVVVDETVVHQRPALPTQEQISQWLAS